MAGDRLTVDPREHARMHSLLDEMNKRISASVSPLLQQAIADGASSSVIASAVANLAMLMLVSTAVGMRSPGQELDLALDMSDSVANQLLNIDWSWYRAQYESARNQAAQPPRVM